MLIACLAAGGWYGYRWYVHGESLPINVPAFASANPDVDESDVSAQQVSDHYVAPHEPRYISIPSLGVNQTRVIGMGLNESGALADPANINDVAWYKDTGIRPGEGGVLLMNGHNGGITRDGVFAKLGSLSAGQTIEVERGDGKTFRYEVRENQSMALDDVNKNGMKMMLQSAEPGKEALNLITCDGVWVPRLQQFDRRIMLRAVLTD